MLFGLLSFPVSGPVSGVRFVVEKLAEAAATELFDPRNIKREIAALEARLERGEIDEDTFERLERDLLMRLQQAQR